jgi:hypothetical protein
VRPAPLGGRSDPGTTVQVDFSGAVQASGPAGSEGARFALANPLPAGSNCQCTPDHALISDIDGYWFGTFPGEVMHFSATDGRPNPQDLTGFLWSNVLNVTAP